jgi:hypothetical protein
MAAAPSTADIDRVDTERDSLRIHCIKIRGWCVYRLCRFRRVMSTLRRSVCIDTGYFSCNKSYCRSRLPGPVWISIQKKCSNRLSFFAEIAFEHIPPSLPVPVTSIAKIALDAMQPGMNPCAFGTRILLGDVVSGIPFPAQPVPHGPEQGDISRWRVAGLHAVKKDSDVFIHDMPLSQVSL